MIQRIILTNRHPRQWIVSAQPFAYLDLIAFRHNRAAEDDLSFFTLNWQIPETRYTISQYVNFYIKGKPGRSSLKKMNMLRCLKDCYKNTGPLSAVELKLGRSFASNAGALIVTLDIPHTVQGK